MRYIADLHIHSHYSRATSGECTPEYLDLWARRKGIQVLGTGDFTHPAWREELGEKLVPAEEGLYVLKEEYRIRDGVADDSLKPRFVLSGEISSIYKKGDKVRKVHSMLLLPGMEEAISLSRKLEAIGNVHSDGRPILGLDCHDLLEIMLESDPASVYIPAHIWTPHFSLFGAFSGFDTLEECFGDLSGHIHALETGLSSDPPMNWRISALDAYNLISNSDAHSPGKLGREANLLDTELSFGDLSGAIQEGRGLLGTLEFFPEEGKYHYDGHRKCHLCLSPSEALKYDGKCPVCGRRLTMGVSHRVEELADREEGFVPEGARGFESLVPLQEVIAASTGRSAAGTKVQKMYEDMLRELGAEFSILREIPVEDIRRRAGYLISEGIRRLRAAEVTRMPGFDGEYGTIKLFEPWEIEKLDGQISLFTREEMAEVFPKKREENPGADTGTQTQTHGPARGREALKRSVIKNCEGNPGAPGIQDVPENQKAPWESLNPAQREAVLASERAVAVIAGPGTGKTKTLVTRIEYLLEARRVKPSQITAVTFTKKAADEMRERLTARLGKKRAGQLKSIGTFHAICFGILKKENPDLILADGEMALQLAEEVLEGAGLKLSAKQFLRLVSLSKTGIFAGDGAWKDGGRKSGEGEEKNLDSLAFQTARDSYQDMLRREGALDFDDLLLEALRRMEADGPCPGEADVPSSAEADSLAGERRKFTYLLVDEFQDISPLQYRLIQAWNRDGRELFVIGDPDQSIYGFRGSDARCFQRLSEDYPALLKIRLSLNYRSAPSIVGGALSMISKNSGQDRELIPRREEDTLIRLVTAKTPMAEAVFATKEINRMIGGIDMLDAQERMDRAGGQRSFSDIAVLYRTHRQADLLEKCLQTEGIPYVVAGRDDFLSDREVRGAVSFFKCLSDPEDSLSLRICRRLLFTRETGEDGMGESGPGALEEILAAYRKSFAKHKPVKLLSEWEKDMGLSESPSLQKLSGMARLYGDMAEFLGDLTFGEEGDLRRCGAKSYTPDAVTLMTLHAAKGLEFPAVILCGVRKGMLPLETGKQPADPEEERRLFYVGMTRAKEELVMVASGEESAFLGDIPEKWMSREDAGKSSASDTGKQMSLFEFMPE